MARVRERLVEAPPKNDVYVLMLVLTVAFVTVGIVLLALDLNTYGWESTPAAPAAVSLPKVEPRPAPKEPKDVPADPKEEPPAGS